MKIYFITLFFIFFSLCVFSQQEESDIVNTTIYDADTITWFGADFSLFKLSNQKKIGQEEELIKYIYAWNENYKETISNVKIANLLAKKKVFNDKDFTDESYKTYLSKTWIESEKNKISTLYIQNHLSHISSSHKGLGLIFIIECFYKGEPSLVSGYFVWFDIESKNIIHIYNVEGTAHSSHFSAAGVKIGNAKGLPKDKGMTGYWLQGMIDATVKFSNNYQESNPFKKEKQY